MGSNPTSDKYFWASLPRLLWPLAQQTLPPTGGYSSVVEHPAAIRQVLGSTPSVPFSFARIHFLAHHTKKHGPNGDLNPGPPAPKAGIIPLDHLATTDLCLVGTEGHRKENEEKKRKKKHGLAAVGFEPTPPKRLVP